MNIITHAFVDGYKSEALTPNVHSFTRPLNEKEAIETLHQSDAHFVGYDVEDAQGNLMDYFPRLTKECLGELISNGMNVKMHMFALDLDSPGHVPWIGNEHLIDTFLSPIVKFIEGHKVLGNYYCMYLTKKGVRYIYKYSQHISTDDHEALAHNLIDICHENNIPVDRLCDWTRLFRLPNVMRDSVPTWTQDYYGYEFKGTELDVSNIPKSNYVAPKTTPKVRIDTSEFKQPEYEDIANFVSDGLHNYLRDNLPKNLKDVLYNYQPLCDPEGGTNYKGEIGRDQSIMSALGSITRLTVRYPEKVTPGHLYCLLAPSVEAFYPDTHTGRDWLDTLWDKCVRVYVLNTSKYETELQVVRDFENSIKSSVAVANSDTVESVEEEVVYKLPKLHRESPVADKILSVVTGFKNAHPEVRGMGNEQLWNFIKEHAILSNKGNFYFILGLNGEYSKTPLKSNQIATEVRTQGLQFLIELDYIDEKGNKRDVPIPKVIDKQSRNVDYIYYSVQKPNRLEDVIGNYPKLHFNINRLREDLEPTYSEEVDEWLTHFAREKSDKDTLVKWIPWALAVDEGAIAGLSITGPRDIGKNMLINGLAECFVSPSFAGEKDLYGDFNQSLLSSNLLWIDEALTQMNTSISVPDILRKVISGGTITVNVKHQPLIHAINPLRVIITANDKDTIKYLCGGTREVSNEARDALLQRFVHIEASAKAGEYLNRRGGINFTGRKGKRWIKGQSNEPSDYVVARHFLWLYKNRHSIEKGKRFLVEGGKDNSHMEEIMMDAQLNKGKMALVLEILTDTLNTYISRPTKGLPLKVDLNLGRFYVTSSYINNVARDWKKDKGTENVTLKDIQTCLVNLINPHPTEARILADKEEMGAIMWVDVNVNVLKRFAVKNGMSSIHIDSLLQAKKTYEELNGEI